MYYGKYLNYNDIICCLFSESGDKTSGGNNTGVEVPSKAAHSSATTDVGKSKKGFSG